jgi:hypothetical protein
MALVVWTLGVLGIAVAWVVLTRRGTDREQRRNLLASLALVGLGIVLIVIAVILGNLGVLYLSAIFGIVGLVASLAFMARIYARIRYGGYNEVARWQDREHQRRR